MRGNKNINPILLKTLCCVCVPAETLTFFLRAPFLLLSLFFLFYKSLIIVVSRFSAAHAEGSAPFLGPVYFFCLMGASSENSLQFRLL